jgi:NADH:ubiquinone oxidoreductase subunit 5 (subunit L)/multisubunit Na+/H+ antiporter MnhA subunit
MINLCTGIYGFVVLHIFTHAFIKASCFVSSGVVISWEGGQDVRSWGIGMESIIMVSSFIILTRFGGSMVYISKEMVMLEILRVLIVILR